MGSVFQVVGLARAGLNFYAIHFCCVGAFIKRYPIGLIIDHVAHGGRYFPHRKIFFGGFGGASLIVYPNFYTANIFPGFAGKGSAAIQGASQAIFALNTLHTGQIGIAHPRKPGTVNIGAVHNYYT